MAQQMGSTPCKCAGRFLGRFLLGFFSLALCRNVGNACGTETRTTHDNCHAKIPFATDNELFCQLVVRRQCMYPVVHVQMGSTPCKFAGRQTRLGRFLLGFFSLAFNAGQYPTAIAARKFLSHDCEPIWLQHLSQQQQLPTTTR